MRGGRRRLAIVLFTGAALMNPIAAVAAQAAAELPAPSALLHTSEIFEFRVDAQIQEVFPLFGADRERAWAPGWAPRFLWPAPAQDHAGMVFTVDHAGASAIWINTAFDLETRHVQYVYVLPAVEATLIDLRLAPDGEGTHVQVRYERTALSEDARTRVAHMAAHDRKAGPEWARQIAQALKAGH